MKLTLCIFISVCVLSLASAKRYEGRYHGKHVRRGGNTCKTMCLQFVSEIQRRVRAIEILTDKPAENSTMLKPYGEEFCKLRAPGSLICQGLMRSHHDIFDGIVKGVKAETICKKIPLCSPRRFRPRKDKKKRRGDRKPLNWSPKKRCDICRATIQIVDSSLAIFNYTEIEIDKLVMLSCKFMSTWGSVQKECENIVRQVERVERLLMKDLSPGDVCAVLGYCNYSKDSVEQTAECGVAGKVASMSPFRTAFSFIRNFVPKVFSNQGNDTIGSLLKRTSLVSTVAKCINEMDDVSLKTKVRKARSITEGSRCQVCTVLSKGSLRRLEMDEEVKGLTSNLGKICDGVSSEYAKHRCKIVSAILGKPESMIADVISPEVCNRVPCSIVTQRGMIKADEKACEICKMVVKIVGQEANYVDKLIGMISDEVNMICKTFGGEEAQAVCAKVSSALKKLADAVTKAFSVPNICKEIGLCPNNPDSKPKQLQ